MSDNIIKIFDTTLRDGEQSPGASMNTEEKIQIALQLERLGVDVIEAGFAAASPGDFESIRRISEQVTTSAVCSLARALEKDVKAAAEATAGAKYQRIHIVLATSPIHMEYKLKMTPQQVIKRAVDAITYAKTFANDVEFSCEDAGRSDIGFLKEIADAVIEAGALTLNIPDTVGYRLPFEMASLIGELHAYMGNRAILSVHNHNDLGLAVANSLACVLAGARQVECTINGLGERAGNAALEEVVMAIHTRADIFPFRTNINIKEIYSTSKLVSTITGIEPQPNKAIVGKNAFAHESGIHQDGVLKHKETYEIINPKDIGLEQNSIVLGKHSGRHAFKDRLLQLGHVLSDTDLNNAFEKFKIIADQKKEIFDDDLRALVANHMVKIPQVFELVTLQLSDCNPGGVPNAAVTIKYNDTLITDAAIGNGTMDAVFKVIDRVCKVKGELKDYKVDAVTSGKDALARVVVKVAFDNKNPIIGHGLDVDTMFATAAAYIGALNSYMSMKEGLEGKVSLGGV